MRAIQIALKVGCRNSNCPVDIDTIYIKGERLDGFYKKETVYDYVRDHSRSIQVDLFSQSRSAAGAYRYGRKIRGVCQR